MTGVFAISACVVLGLLAVFQLALAAGAPLGNYAWGGQSRVLPTRLRIGSAVSIVIYGVIAAVLLEQAGVTHWIQNPGLVQVLSWVIFGYFVLGILMNAISRSKPERFTMTPVTLVLAVLSFMVALG